MSEPDWLAVSEVAVRLVEGRRFHPKTERYTAKNICRRDIYANETVIFLKSARLAGKVKYMDSVINCVAMVILCNAWSAIGTH